MTNVPSRRAGAIILSRERVKAEIFDAISKGDFSYGSAMSERALGERLGVSRTPVREALQELAREGIVDIHPARGAFLKRISAKELQDLYEMRLNLECIAVYRTARYGDHERLKSFEALFEPDDEILDDDALTEEERISEAFHLEIFLASENDLLLLMYEKMLLKVRMLRRISRDHFTERYAQSRRDHRGILRAIFRRDADEARRLMSEHLLNGFNLRMRLFQTIPDHPIVILETRAPRGLEPDPGAGRPS